MVLKDKLKNLKSVLRWWNVEVFGIVDAKIHDVEFLVNNLDIKAEVVGLEVEDLMQRRNPLAELWQRLRDKETLLRQKSRQKWIKEGDANTSFFHASISVRRKRNQLAGILVDGQWVEKASDIKKK